MLILLTLNHSQPFKNHPIINNRITLKESNDKDFFFTENHKTQEHTKQKTDKCLV